MLCIQNRNVILGEDDVTSLNGLGAEWADVIAVALFKPLRNQLTEFLPLYRLGPKVGGCAWPLKGIGGWRWSSIWSLPP